MEVIQHTKVVAVDTETSSPPNPHKVKLVGYSTASSEFSHYIHYPKKQDLDTLKTFLADKQVVGQNIKYDVVVLSRNGIRMRAYWDTKVAQYLLDIDKPTGLKATARRLLGVERRDLVEIYNECTDSKRTNLPDDFYKDIPKHVWEEYGTHDAEDTLAIYELQKERFKEHPELYKWFLEVEMPLLNIVIESELKGVRVNTEKLHSLQEKYEKVRHENDSQLRWMCGKPEVNLNSSKQLQEILYKDLKLPKGRKTKTGWSTDTKTLAVLSRHHAFPKMLLRHREVEKMLNSFVVPLQEEADNEGYLHATYNQTTTRTRRFSCSNPNLQQIPSRKEIGREIRECFVPSPGNVFVIADYSQIEPRLLAHFSGEPLLTDWFKNGEDVYDKTNEVMGGGFTRPQCKILLLSFMYGKTEYGLGKDLECSVVEAREILNKAFGRFKKVQEYIHEQHEECKRTGGWIKSLAGLPLFIEGINSMDRWKYEEALRQSVNYRIQSSSQDILKRAIVNVKDHIGLTPCLMVHDELVYDIAQDPNSSTGPRLIGKLISDTMENAWKLDVPLKVEWNISSHWEKG